MKWGKGKGKGKAAKEGGAHTFTAHARPHSTEALDALVTGLFDYAGMFPPANLELDTALAESARSLRLRRPQMVGADIVVTLQDLAKLDEGRLRTAGFGDTEVKATVVGVAADRLDDAVVDVAEKNAEMGGVLRVVGLEAHGTTFPGASLVAAAKAIPRVHVAIEPRMPDSAWVRNGPGILRLLDRIATEGVVVGLKVRGSGENAIGAGTLGWLIPQAVKQRTPFKATAGLHHPVVEAQYGNALGFVGLAAAVRFRQVLGEGFPLDAVQQCVAEAQPRAFGFDKALRWRGYEVETGRLREAVRELPFTIGSCSLGEPDEDLARLFDVPAAQG